MKIKILLSIFLTGITLAGWSQVPFHTDSVSHAVRDSLIRLADADSALRIININPNFNQHVDSMLSYQFQINRDPAKYYWYLRNSPVGLKINKDDGLLTFKPEKSYFLSGKLKYDFEYRVLVGVQSLSNPKDKFDTSFSLTFYNTEIIPSKLKPSISGTLTVYEGDPVSFKVQCETGSFPIEDILFSSSISIINYSLVKKCDDEFNWTPGYDFVNAETDQDKQKTVNLIFIGSTKFKTKDTATVKVIVKDALNYPLANQEFKQVAKSISTYSLQLKYTFLQIDKRLKKTKGTRSTFDLTTAATALTGTVLATSSSPSAQNTGKVLPSVGVALVPVKEATAPPKTVEQNQATLIRSSIKRLDYILYDNQLIGDKDPDVLKKTNKLKEELKQLQVQLIDVPTELSSSMTEEELNNYFNSPKVNKKYRLKK
ncbi:MAG: hypothetical protein ABUT20_09715 [Bacteroidota bacterium]